MVVESPKGQGIGVAVHWAYSLSYARRINSEDLLYSIVL